MKTKSIPPEHLKRLETLSNFIRELRIQNNITQEEVSPNIHRNSISRIENNRNFGILLLFELCDSLEIGVGELFEMIE
jgi:transcriptional regulator with XRE-family HTH domain